MNTKSSKKANKTKSLVNRCISKLRNKSIDYKIRFAELLINLYDVPLQEGIKILDYIFYKNIRKSDREVANEEYDQLYDVLSIKAITRDVNNATMEELEEQDKIFNAEMDYLQLYNEDRERERKYNEILSRGERGIMGCSNRQKML